ncbi:hypothetical protein [Gordonia aurantiaca]|uniref:hypothetical protein n=1 Tax=Gordonia sp. B21 TaxID=3151852 RepID=UPI0032677E38
MLREIGDHLAHGRIRHVETVFDGLDAAPEALVAAPEALVATLGGWTTGKTLVRLEENRS